MAALPLHPGLQCISQLFSYPAGQTVSAPLPEGAGAETEQLRAEMQAIDPLRLENEYVRLFINAMPEVPCAPYGSVYLEGSVMGESTVKVAAIYQKYGIATEELADHIAVESEFLAWLHGTAANNADAQRDYEYILGHLRKWTGPFFSQIEQHDQLGYYRHCAEFARKVLRSLEESGVLVQRF